MHKAAMADKTLASWAIENKLPMILCFNKAYVSCVFSAGSSTARYTSVDSIFPTGLAVLLGVCYALDA